MVTLQDTIRKIRKLALTGAVTLLAAKAATAGLCCDVPRAYYSPACEPAWGYHQTCWRRFPCLEPCTGWGDYCPTCQQDDGGVQYAGAWQQQPVQGQVVPATPPAGQYLQGTPMQGNVIYQNAGPQPAPMSSMQIPSGGMQPAPYNPPAGAVPYYSTTPTSPQPGAGAPIPMGGTAPSPGATSQKQVTPSPVSPGAANPYPSNTAPMPMNDNDLPMPMPTGEDDQARIYQMPNGYTHPTSYNGNRGPTNYGGHPVQQQQQRLPQTYGNPQAAVIQQQVPANGGWVQQPGNQVQFNQMPGNVPTGSPNPFRSVSYGTQVQQQQPQQIQQPAAPVEVKRSLWSRLTGK